MKHFRHILIGTLLLLTSCIENSIPYPVVTLQILGVEGEGFTCSPEDINTQERIVAPSGRTNRHIQREDRQNIGH